MPKTPILYRILRPFVTFMMLRFYNLKIENKDYIPKEGSCIIAGNHKFYFDPLCVDVSTKRTVYSLCHEDYYYPYEFFFKNVGSIPVHEKKDGKALGRAIDYLKEGAIINVSPEAMMNKTDELLLPFKRGAAIMAKEANSIIIPYAVTGDYKFRSKNLKITFGKPISADGLSIEQANELLFESVKQLLLDNK